MALIKCNECGAEVSDKASKCPKCGYPISQHQIPDETNRSSEESYSSYHQKPKQSNNNLLYVLGGILVLLLLLVLAGLFMKSRNDGSTDYVEGNQEMVSLNQASEKEPYEKNGDENRLQPENVEVTENPSNNAESLKDIETLLTGTTVYNGDMAGFPISIRITKKSEDGTISAIYKNIKYSTEMRLTGSIQTEGLIKLVGSDNGTEWKFTLYGNVNSLNGTAVGDGKSLPVKLERQ